MKSTYCEYILEKILSTSEVGPILALIAPSPLIGHATEMIKLQFTMITDRIRNKIRNGNWFPKFSINRKELKFLPICLRLLTLLTIIKDPSLRGLTGNQDRQKFDF
jgi:hypothetical protein